MPETCPACHGPVRVQTDPTEPEGTHSYVPLGDIPWPPLDGSCCPLCARPGVDPAVLAYEPQKGSEEPLQTLYGLPVATDERVPPGTFQLRTHDAVPVAPGPFLPPGVYPALTRYELGVLTEAASAFRELSLAQHRPLAFVDDSALQAVLAKVASFSDPGTDPGVVLPGSFQHVEQIVMDVADAKVRDQYGDCVACGVSSVEQHLPSCWWARAHAWATLCNVDEIDDRERHASTPAVETYPLVVPAPRLHAPERAGRQGDTQGLPVPNDQPHIHDLVATDLEARKQLGIRRYGAPLQAFNGRDPLLDAYEETLDQAVYLKQALVEAASGAPRLGSALLIADDQERILFGLRGKEPAYRRWVLPGGKVEPFETLAGAASREALEETGLEVEVGRLAHVLEIIDPEQGQHRVIAYHWATVTGGQACPSSDLLELRWVTPDQSEDLDITEPVAEVLTEVGWWQDSHRHHAHVSLRDAQLAELPATLREMATLAVSEPLRAQDMLTRLALVYEQL